MPSITTHKIFALDVLNKYNINVDRNLYIAFAQSFDNLIYYKYLHPIMGKKVYKLNKKGHRDNTQEYLINIIKIIKKYHYEKDAKVLSYLYGSIAHFVMDTTFHPYIFYKTGVYRKKDRASKKYYLKHTEIEAMLNAYFYNKKEKTSYHNYKIHKFDFPKIKFNQSLKNTIKENYKTIYNFANLDKIYLKSYNLGRIGFFLAIEDKYGIKKCFYKLLDKIFNTKLEYSSYFVKIINPVYLNLERNKWFHPLTNKEYNYSVDDLYEICIKKTINIFKNVDLVLNDKKDISELYKVIPNISYVTGADCKNKAKLKYFEY